MGRTYIIKSSKEESALATCTKLLNEPKLDVTKNHPDILVCEAESGKNSIGIETARELTKFLTQRPFSAKQKAVIVKRAHLLTIPAQNALLKTLEEPPAYATIFLLTDNTKKFLPTILSRCQLINLRDANDEATQKWKYESIVAKTRGQRFAVAEELSKEEKADVTATLNSWLVELHKAIIKGSVNSKDAANAEKILEIRNDIEKTNVNTKLALENLLLNL